MSIYGQIFPNQCPEYLPLILEQIEITNQVQMRHNRSNNPRYNTDLPGIIVVSLVRNISVVYLFLSQGQLLLSHK